MRSLCLGNNTEDTDVQTQTLSGTQPFHGLLSECDGRTLTSADYAAAGWYHSSVFDLDISRLRQLCATMDQVIVLDQPKHTYNHPDAFLHTVQLGLQVNAVFQNPHTTQWLQYWENLVEQNNSFCIFPFIELVTHFDHTTVCCRSTTPITNIKNLKDFRTDHNHQTLRHCMLAGQQLPDHCSVCYRDETLGIRSARQQETVEWANRLNLDTVADLDALTAPVYYEVRASNRCNLQCRMCTPYDSHRIEKLHKKIGWLNQSDLVAAKNTQGFDIVDLDHVRKLYVSGGEPTLMPQFYDFLLQCIQRQRTDFEIQINTNGTKLTKRFRDLLARFSNVNFILSLDGHGAINDYIRHASNFDTIVKNWQWLRSHGHTVSVNTTVSMYNITCLADLFEFIDQTFPNTMIHCQAVDSDGSLSLLNHPDSDAVIEHLESIQHMACYQRSAGLASFIDGVLTHYRHRPQHDPVLLADFFAYDRALNLGMQPLSLTLAQINPDLAKFDKDPNVLQKIAETCRVQC